MCAAIIQTDLAHPLWGWLEILPALGVLVGVFQETGFKPAAQINELTYLAWSLWLI